MKVSFTIWKVNKTSVTQMYSKNGKFWSTAMAKITQYTVAF